MTHIYQLDDTDLLRNANKTLGVVVDSLRREGFLTQEQASTIHTHYSVIIERKDWLPEFLAKYLAVGDSALKVRLVKAVGREKETAT